MNERKYKGKTTPQLVEDLRKRCSDGFCLGNQISVSCELCPLTKQSMKTWGVDVLSIE